MLYEHLTGSVKDKVERQQALAQAEQNASDLLYLSIMLGVDITQDEQSESAEEVEG